MQTKTAKFGGSSLADAGMFRRVYKIIKSDPSRRFIVPSAPGKRFKDDQKITDLLYLAYDLNNSGQDPEPAFSKVRQRFDEIIDGLGLNLNLKSEFDQIEKYFSIKIGRDFFASRGEYLSGIVLANLLGYEFIDPADYIFFKENGEFDFEKTNITLSAKLKNVNNAVIPGFFGATVDGVIKTFPRGGSDITGALVARATNSFVYENWTDVSGILISDPKIVENPKPIPTLSYSELREMSYMGAGVLHEDAVYPVRLSHIPINVKNTMKPEDVGTVITDDPENEDKNTFGIIGKKGYCAIKFKKNRLNHSKGFLYRLIDIFERNDVYIDLCPIGVDKVSVYVNDKIFSPKKNTIIQDVKDILSPEEVIFENDLSLIAVVGNAVRNSETIFSGITSALSKNKISLHGISKSFEESLIILAVKTSDFQNAINAIYHELV